MADMQSRTTTCLPSAGALGLQPLEPLAARAIHDYKVSRPPPQALGPLISSLIRVPRVVEHGECMLSKHVIQLCSISQHQDADYHIQLL